VADTIRIKRRVTGSPGAPASLANAEVAYNEVDHILYYGEGTGGAGGTASIITAIGGQGLSSNTAPIMDGTASPGSSSFWSRGDHSHATDTTRAPLASPTFTGSPAAPTPTPSTDNTTRLATTAFVQNVVAALSTGVTSVTAGSGLSGGGTGAVTINVATNGITNALSAQMPALSLKGNATGAPANATDLTAAQALTLLNAASLNSPSFTGIPLAPTAANGTNTTQIATTAFVLGTRLDQLAAPSVNVSFNSKNITNLLDPVNPQDAATKNYVDTAVQGLSQKAAVQVATTTAITLSGTQTIDGIAVTAGQRALVKDQGTASQNGIYIVQSTAWTRAGDLDSWLEVPDAYVFVMQGTANADTGWVCTADPGGVIGTTAMPWVQFSAAGQISAGSGLQKVGNVLSVVGTVNRISVGATVDIDAGYIGQSTITTLGTISSGIWNASTIVVGKGGTGATTLTGYLKGNGASAFTAVGVIPAGDISGLGTMASQNANAVAITGGTIDGITLDGGTF
jgi:hypothetical protein